MKHVYIAGGIIACLGLLYWGAYTKGATNEKDRCHATQITVVKTIEAKRQAVSAVVDSADDTDVMRMLCEKYARGGCVWPDNIPNPM